MLARAPPPVEMLGLGSGVLAALANALGAFPAPSLSVGMAPAR